MDKRNATGTAIPRGSYTGAMSQDLFNEDGTFADVILDVETAGTGNITLTIRGKLKDGHQRTAGAVGPIYYTILQGAAVSSANTPTAPNVYRVGPGLTASANVAANFILPGSWNIEVAKSDSSAWVFQVGYQIVQ